MVSEDTWLNKNSLLILNFFFIAFILWWKANFLIMELIVSFPDDIEVSSSQWKRFNESLFDRECLLKIAVTSFCLITFYPFQATLHFLVHYYFYLRSTVYMLLKWFGITINTKFLKVLQFGLFIQICRQVLLSLKLGNVILWLICLVFEIWSDHYLLSKVLTKMGLLIPL